MSERMGRERPDEELDARLRDLAAHATYPPTPRLASAAARRLQAGSQTASARWPGLRRLAPLIAVVLLLVLASVVLALSFGLPGVRFFVQPVLPSANVASNDIRSTLGARADLAAARELLGRRLLVPAALGSPDEVYVAGPGEPQSRIALLYGVQQDLPPLAGDIGLLFTQWTGTLDEIAVRKWLDDSQGSAERVTVRGNSGYWLSGKPHAFEYLDHRAGVDEHRIRLVGDVLVWVEGDTIYRIESGLGRDATLAIAASLTAE
jgi:hypothetical protein